MLTRQILLVLSFLFLGGCIATTSVSIITTAPNGALEPIPAALFKPDGPGPFPAIVIMHDCSGIGPRSSGAPERWARELMGPGYVVLIPDSFTTRAHAGGVCTNPAPSRNEISPFGRVGDAYAALAYLRTLPYVDGTWVGLMGGSHGGTTTLASMVAPESDSARPIRYIGERVNVNSPTGRGATTGGDPHAWADSIREVAAFFEQHLRQKQD
jgi:dienelactone hydrolase